MVLLGIIDLNGQFFIKVDDAAVELQTLSKKYWPNQWRIIMFCIESTPPPSLIFVFGFFERWFGLEPTTVSVNGENCPFFFLSNENRKE